MRTRTISMLVMSAGMAWAVGCAEWRDDRADSTGYRSIDDREADRHADTTWRGRSGDTRGVSSPDFYGSSPYSPANRGMTDGAAVSSTGWRGDATTPPQMQYSTAPDRQGPSSAKTSDRARAADTSGATDGQVTGRDGRYSTTGAQDQRSTTTRAPQHHDRVTGPGEIPESQLTGAVHDHDLKTVNPDGRSYTMASDGRAMQSTTTSPDPRGSSPYSPANRGDTTAAARTDGQVTGRAGDTTYSSTASPDARGSSPYSPANRGDATTAEGRETRATQDAYWRDDRAGDRVVTDSRYGSETTTQRDAQGREYRTGAREEDTYGGSPDAYGSSPYSPANRGVRVTQYDRRGVVPLQRDTSWQDAAQHASWDPGAAYVTRETQRDVTPAHPDQRAAGYAERTPGPEGDRARPEPIDARMPAQAGVSDTDRDAVRMDDTAVQDATVGVSPDSRILSIIHAKNLEEVEMGKLAQSKGESADVRQFGAELVRDHSRCDEEVQSLAQSHDIMLMDADQVKEMLKREKGKLKDAGAYKDRHERDQGLDAQADKSKESPAADHEQKARDAGDQAMQDKDLHGQGGDDKAMKHAKDPMAHLQTLSGSEFDKAFADMMLKEHRKLIGIIETARTDTTTKPELMGFLDRTLETLRKHERTAQQLAGSR